MSCVIFVRNGNLGIGWHEDYQDLKHVGLCLPHVRGLRAFGLGDQCGEALALGKVASLVDEVASWHQAPSV